MNWKFFVFFTILSLFIQSVYPQIKNHPENFRFFTADQGLYNNKITGLLQDNSGNLWIGTDEGIYTYNGNKFQQFSAIDEPIGKIVNGRIQKIFKDRNGNIWIGANTGVCIYAKDKDEFINSNLPPAEDYLITSFAQNSKDTVWIGTNKGIFEINESGNIINQWNYKRPGDFVHLTIFENDIWLINYNSICRFNNTSGAYTDTTQYNFNGNTADNLLTSIAKDKSGNIWIGKYNGLLYKFNVKEKKVQKFDIKSDTKNPAAIINHLYYDSLSNKIWLSVDEGGIYSIAPNKDSIQPFLTRAGTNTGIPTLKISEILIDRERNFWIAMEKHGLAMTNNLINSFLFINPQKYTSTSIISSVLKDSKGTLWVGTDGGGLLKFDSENRFQQLFKNNSQNLNSISNDAILSIFEDSKKRIWTGSFRGGLSLYNHLDNRFTNYLAGKDTINGLPRNDIRKIAEDREGNLWLVVHGYGVTKFNPETGVFKNYSGFPSPWLVDLTIDKKGTVWAASADGIAFLENGSNNFIPFKTSLTNAEIHTLYEDNSGRLYIGTGKGLYYFENDRKTIQQLPADNILNRTSIESIEQSGDGKLIVATRKGLVFYDVKTNLSSYFGYGSGLPSERFISNSSSIHKGTEVFLGTVAGLCMFRTTEINPLILEHKPQISSITIFNEPLEEVIPINRPVSHLSLLKLSHNQNNLTFSFSYPYFKHHSSEYYFQYMMEGIDKSWKETEIPVAVYPSLPPGNFNLRIRIVSKVTLQIHSPETSIQIQIYPPWWDTMLFKTIAILLVILLCYLYFRRKTQQILLINKLLEEKVTERTEAISRQNEILEKQRAELEYANKSKDKLFSVIAHDLRSPFSSIFSISDLFQNKFDRLSAEDKTVMVNMLRKSSDNTFKLLENLLTWARSQTHGIRYNPEKISLKELLYDIHSAFEKIVIEKQIILRIEMQDEIIIVSDKEMLGTILRNLLSNAIKFTPIAGEVSLLIQPVSDIGLTIEVRDSGTGMSPSQVEKILNSNTDLITKPGTAGERGTGLGLLICKEFLSAISGKWEIISEINKGTIFKITIATQIEILPFVVTERQKESTESAETALAGTLNLSVRKQNKVILIVEDQKEILESLRIFLSEFYQILTAQNGAEAWQVVQENFVDLILSDLVMPEMDGITFCNLCKEQAQTNHIPIMLLTSKKEEEDMLKGLQSGVDDYLIKPVNPDVLLLKINTLLKTRELLKRKFSLDNNQLLESYKENTGEKEFLANVLKIIEDHLHDAAFSVEDLSKNIGMHRSSLSKKLVAVANVTPNELIKIQRLKKSAQLLLKGGLNVSQIAYEVGFSDPKYFSRSFKAYFGCLPSDYVQMNLK